MLHLEEEVQVILPDNLEWCLFSFYQIDKFFCFSRSLCQNPSYGVRSSIKKKHRERIQTNSQVVIVLHVANPIHIQLRFDPIKNG